jgi:CheY-like chemotaxis protein
VSDPKRPTILCLSRSSSQLKEILSHLGHALYATVSASSPEQAVAFCAANQVNAIVLDSEFATEGGWTIAQSFRMVTPRLPIVLLRMNHDRKIPAGIDAVAEGTDVVLNTLRMLLAKTAQDDPADSAASRSKPALARVEDRGTRWMRKAKHIGDPNGG